MDIVSRDEWGAKSPKQPYTQLIGSEGIIGHHLGDNVVRNPINTKYAALMRQTQAFHMNNKRWNDFAYGFGVGGGQIYMGRGFGYIDGADTGIGRIMHSVVWLGDSTVNRCPDEDMALIWALFDEHNRIYGKKVEGGHRDINATSCPGEDIYSKLQKGRTYSTSPVSQTQTRKPRSKNMYAVVNADFGVERFVLRSNGEVWNQWQDLPNKTFSHWQRTFEGTWFEGLSQPVRVGPRTLWMGVSGDASFGFVHMTAINDGPGLGWKLHVTNQLINYLESIK